CSWTTLVHTALVARKALALEDLRGMWARLTIGRAQRSEQHAWAFFQLRQFHTYKAAWAGSARAGQSSLHQPDLSRLWGWLESEPEVAGGLGLYQSHPALWVDGPCCLWGAVDSSGIACAELACPRQGSASGSQP